MKFLDCTLRDGGYYNKWDFDPKQAKRLIHALNNAGTEIIEVGYKAPASPDEYFGLFRYCNEQYLQFLSKDDPADYAFMIDVKDFVDNNGIKRELLDHHVKPAHESVFTWVRLASHFNTIEQVPDLTAYFKDKGYKVTLNLMGGSLLSDEQFQRGAEVAKEAAIDVFYLVDSFGAFYPEDVQRLIRLIKGYYNDTIGIHTHDNQGMAYANTLVAIEEGVEFVDGTVTGMGRGAGNLHTEQFLTGYGLKYSGDGYNGNALLKVIDDFIQPLKDYYQWGYNPTYMFSGLKNIHPTYCQNLIESNRYTVEEINGILQEIPEKNRAKFNSQALEEAVQRFLKIEVAQEEGKDVKHFDLQNLHTEAVVILARGQQAEQHIPNLLQLINKHNWPLIECNPTGFLENDEPRNLAILNQVRLQKWLQNAGDYPNTTLVSGFPVYSKNVAGGRYPFEIGDFDINSEQEVVIPDYDVGLYAIAIALKAGAGKILLAGFDGFDDPSQNRSKELLFKQVASIAEQQGAELSYITPSEYSVFQQRSLYEF
jgi:4-hydroxy 2-oxovalerate aldolase